MKRGRHNKDIETAKKLSKSAISAGCSVMNLREGHKTDTTPTANSGKPDIEYSHKKLITQVITVPVQSTAKPNG